MEGELLIVGSPPGPKPQADSLEKRIIGSGEVNGFVEKLDAHYGFFILKKCFSLPELLYFLRTSTCFNYPALLEGTRRFGNNTVAETSLSPKRPPKC